MLESAPSLYIQPCLASSQLSVFDMCFSSSRLCVRQSIFLEVFFASFFFFKCIISINYNEAFLVGFDNVEPGNSGL